MSAIQNKKRDLQPETVQVAKRQADCLIDIFSERGVTLKRSEALEGMARLHGARDWNTFRAGLATDEEVPVKKTVSSEEEIRRFLLLDQGNPELCAGRMITLAGPGPDHGGMWRSRAARMLEAILPVLFWRARTEGRGLDLKGLRSAMTLEGALDLYDWLDRNGLKGGPLRQLHIHLSNVSGFDLSAWRKSRSFDPKTLDEDGFACDIWAKMIDDLTKGDIPIPAVPASEPV